MFNNCTSLTTAPELPATTLAYGCYDSMFYNCTSLATSPDLPATTLASSCYDSMFYGTNVLPDCSNINFRSSTVVASRGLRGLFAGTKVTDEDLRSILPINSNGKYYLPVTVLYTDCYQYMFSHCTSLKTAPELPATTLAGNCYESMFNGCSSLTTAPDLPAITLAQNCYDSMFRYCTSLTKAPALPATYLTDHCYDSMFSYCTSLTKAPDLPAATLVKACYQNMFFGCEKLNHIKMLATYISAFYCLNNWVYRVASSGTFVKNKDATWDVTGVSGVPSGWTVQTA